MIELSGEKLFHEAYVFAIHKSPADKCFNENGASPMIGRLSYNTANDGQNSTPQSTVLKKLVVFHIIMKLFIYYSSLSDYRYSVRMISPLQPNIMQLTFSLLSMLACCHSVQNLLSSSLLSKDLR